MVGMGDESRTQLSPERRRADFGPRRSGVTYIRLISAVSASDRQTPPQATSEPSTEPTRNAPSGGSKSDAGGSLPDPGRPWRSSSSAASGSVSARAASLP